VGLAILREWRPVQVSRPQAAVAMNYFAYNFIQIHCTLRRTPAMPAGVTGRLWGIEDLAAPWGSHEQHRAEGAP
jgi:hypothetical protein